MSSVVISGDSSGAITLAAPSVAGSNTATLPAATGTVMVSGNMPTVMAYPSSNQSISNASYTKVLFDTESYDTNNNFASSRFTPTVAGFYQINCGTALTAAITGFTELAIYKNGSVFIYGQTNQLSLNYSYSVTGVMVYCNGTTDYIEAYLYQSTGSTQTIQSGQAQTYFQAFLARTA